MLDFEEYTGGEVMKAAVQLIRGSMGRLFYIVLSFFPLYLLGILSMGIGLLWIYPYKEAVFANFYLDLIKKKVATDSDNRCPVFYPLFLILYSASFSLLLIHFR